MIEARQAINSARSADAAAYAPRSTNSAEQLLGHAKQSIEQGRYDIARDDALEARDDALEARQAATKARGGGGVAIAHARVAVQETRGSAWLGVERLIDEAQAAGQQGDESRAWELATESKRRLL